MDLEAAGAFPPIGPLRANANGFFPIIRVKCSCDELPDPPPNQDDEAYVNQYIIAEDDITMQILTSVGLMENIITHFYESVGSSGSEVTENSVRTAETAAKDGIEDSYTLSEVIIRQIEQHTKDQILGLNSQFQDVEYIKFGDRLIKRLDGISDASVSYVSNAKNQLLLILDIESDRLVNEVLTSASPQGSAGSSGGQSSGSSPP